MLKIEIVDSIEKMMLLKDTWNKVLEKSNCDSVFLTWEWFYAWWKNFGKGKELFIILVKKDEQIIAILPFMKIVARCFGFPVRKIKAIKNEYTPYYDIITTDESREALQLVLQYLKGLKWDVIELESILSQSKTVETIEGLVKKSLFRLQKGEVEHKSPYIPINCSWKEYYETLSSKLRNTMRKGEKRAEKEGRIMLDEINNSDNIDELLEKFFQIEAAGWKGKKKTAILHCQDAKSFYTDLAYLAIQKGWLSLFFLKLNNKGIAADYCLRYKGVMNAQKTGYDAAYSRYSPANLLRMMVLEKIFEGNFTKYDFLGTYSEWKKEWTNYTEEFVPLRVYKNGIYQNFLYYLQFGIKGYLKRNRFLVKFKKYILIKAS